MTSVTFVPIQILCIYPTFSSGALVEFKVKKFLCGLVE